MASTTLANHLHTASTSRGESVSTSALAAASSCWPLRKDKDRRLGTKNSSPSETQGSGACCANPLAQIFRGSLPSRNPTRKLRWLGAKAKSSRAAFRPLIPSVLQLLQTSVIKGSQMLLNPRQRWPQAGSGTDLWPLACVELHVHLQLSQGAAQLEWRCEAA